MVPLAIYALEPDLDILLVNGIKEWEKVWKILTESFPALAMEYDIEQVLKVNLDEAPGGEVVLFTRSLKVQ